jgi:hypothetical protein
LVKARATKEAGMVSQGSSLFWNWVEGWFSRLIPFGLAASALLLLLVITGLIVFALDRQAFKNARAWVLQNLSLLVRWLPALMAVAFASFALGVVQIGVSQNVSSQSNAVYGKNAKSLGDGTIQYSPSVSFEEETTLQRRFTIPPEIATKLGENPEEVLQRYINDNPINRVVTKVDDTFTQQKGGAILYQRTATIRERKPVALETVDLKVVLEGVQNSSEGAYKAKFNGRYVFSNPQDKPSAMRFIFPLPNQSGTLSGFQMTLNGQPVQVADLSNGYVWEGTLPAKAKAEVQVQYNNQGDSSWGYDFGQRREPIRDFKLQVITPRAAEFAVRSLFPTSEKTNTYEWQLQNVITSQDVEVALPTRSFSLIGTLDDLYSFAPLALLAMIAWSLALAWRRGIALEPARLVIAVLALTVGVALSGVLIWYVPIQLATWLGALVSMVLALATLGKNYVLPIVLSSAAPLAFLSVDAALILMILALIALLTLLPSNARENLRTLLAR